MRNDRRYDPRGRFASIEKRLDDLEAINAMVRGVSRPATRQKQALDFIVAHQAALKELIEKAEAVLVPRRRLTARKWQT